MYFIRRNDTASNCDRKNGSRQCRNRVWADVWNEAKALSEKLKEKDKMTWLFMGDSITHAALWTKGYDGIAQTFEKYLKDEMGRASDTVINTAVSGATTTSTLNNIEQRLENILLT